MRLSTLFAGIVAATASCAFASPAPDASSCALNDSPAYAATKAAFEGFKNARMYILGSIVNDEPTHSELQAASKWQLGEVQKSYDQAKSANNGDAKWARKEFYAAKLAFLEVELKVANKMVNHGLPKFPWLGKAISWAQDKWKKIKELFQSWFGGKSNGNGNAQTQNTATTAPAPAPVSTPTNPTPKPVSPKETREANQLLDQHEADLNRLDKHIQDLETDMDRCEL